MCKICLPILGIVENMHTESECPLAASAQCSYCGVNGHFTKTCEHKPTAPLKKIRADPVAPHPSLLRLADDDRSVSSFLAAQGLERHGRQKKNREEVEKQARKTSTEVVWIARPPIQPLSKN